MNSEDDSGVDMTDLYNCCYCHKIILSRKFIFRPGCLHVYCNTCIARNGVMEDKCIQCTEEDGESQFVQECIFPQCTHSCVVHDAVANINTFCMEHMRLMAACLYRFQENLQMARRHTVQEPSRHDGDSSEAVQSRGTKRGFVDSSVTKSKKQKLSQKGIQNALVQAFQTLIPMFVKE